MTDHILNCYDEYKENDCVIVKYGDANIGPHSGEQGTVVRVLSPNHVMIRINGQEKMMAADAISPCNTATPTAPGTPVVEFKLLKGIMNRKQLAEGEMEALAAVGSAEHEEPEPFEAEIKAMLVQKVSGVTAKLLTLKHSWEQTHTQQLGPELSDFIEFFLPQLDQLVAVVSAAQADSDLNHARRAFEELLELTASVKGTPTVRGWTDLQYDALKAIFE